MDLVERIYKNNIFARRIKFLNSFSRTYDVADCECTICGNKWTTVVNHLLKTTGCPKCRINGKYIFTKEESELYNITSTKFNIIVGVNDLATVRPNLVKYFVDKSIPYKVHVSNKNIVELKCDVCGKISKKKIVTLNQRGLTCPYCRETNSYPNRFIINLVSMLKNIEYYKHEYSPDWAKPYRFDMYMKVNDNNIIVEMDGGLGHGKQSFKDRKQLDTIGLQRDIIKNELCDKNNFIMIRINCEISDFEFIKENILKSELINYVDLSNFDWKELENKLSTNTLKSVCDFFNKQEGFDKLPINISKHFNCSREHISDLLKKGTKLGLCNYDEKEIRYLSAMVSKKTTRKKINCLYLQTDEVKQFESLAEAHEKTTITTSTIKRSLEEKCVVDGRNVKRIIFFSPDEDIEVLKRTMNTKKKTKSYKYDINLYSIDDKFLGTYTMIDLVKLLKEKGSSSEKAISCGIRKVCLNIKKSYLGYKYNYSIKEVCKNVG